jgi:protein-S-isoprenylcysteine O-methyltransferase Ste14
VSPDRDDPLVTPLPDDGTRGSADPGTGPARGRRPSRRERRRSANMLPQRERRTWPERMLVRLIATAGIVGVGVAIGAIMVASNSQGWIVGLVVSVVSVVLAALLWSSRVL